MDDIQFSEFLDESIPLWRNDPVMFFREVLNFEPDEWQAEAARDLAANPKVSIKSGQGVGKTGLEAAVFLWFITCFPYPRIVATAPTKQQLHDVLWSEISKWMSKSELLSMLLKWTKTYVYMVGNEKRWFGVARTATKPENMQGFHEDNMLFMTSISSFDTENVIAPLNANANAGNEELKGYQVAAYIAGIVAATPANQSVTHATLSRYSVLNEILTNTEMEVAEEKGCLVLSTASDGAVWIDNGVNTLVHPDANHDSGWKKIRRTKTRYELLNRANAAADALVGKVDNDTNGRATIMAAIQGICNAMEAEGKIQYGNVTESTTVTTDGDTCGFDIEVIDLDSAEHIYLNYYFQFSTIVAASGE